MKNEIATFRSQRSSLLDALKGFALLGVLMLTYVQHFLYPYLPDSADLSHWFWIADRYVYGMVVAMLELKVLGFFALIFGVSFNFQYSKQKARNRSSWQTNIWRLYILGFFAFIFAALMPNGGGLLLLVAMGFMLSFLRRLSRQSLLIIIGICLLQPFSLMQYLWSLIDPSFTPLVGRETQMYHHLSMLATIDEPFAYVSENIVTGVMLSLKLFIFSGFTTVLFALMLFGYWLGRKNLMNHMGYKHDWWVRCLQITMAAVIVFGLLSYNIEVFAPKSDFTKVLVSILDNWVDGSLVVALVSAFVLLFKSDRYPKINSLFVVYGRMSLTNYMLQSVIGVLLFLPVGLSLAQYCGSVISLLIAGVVLALLVMFSWWWQQRWTRGPLEHLVHRLTWL